MSAPLAAERPSAARIWLMAARPRTLPAAVAPVLVGTALAATEGTFKRRCVFTAAMIGALFIQVGTNLSNDYSDARRGADTEDRLGPGAGHRRRARAAAAGADRDLRGVRVAVLAGCYLIAVAGWELLASAPPRSSRACSTPAARGPTATRASARCSCSCSSASSRWPAPTSRRSQRLEWEAFALAVPVGLLASAILVVNNVRDLETDRRAGKRTLAVRLGRERTRVLYAAMVYVAFLSAPVPWLAGAGSLGPWVLLALARAPARACRSCGSCATAPTGRRSTARSPRTGKLQLAFCVLLSAGSCC